MPVINEDMREEVEFPLIQYKDDDVDVCLRIYRKGPSYELEIHSLGRSLRVPVTVSHLDLLRLNKLLQEQLETVIKGLASENVSAYETDTYLRPLAEAGNYAFKAVFGNSIAMEAIRTILSFKQRLSIEIASEEFFLPWELLYADDLDGELSYEHFWGMKYLISRVIVQNDRPGAFVPPIIPYSVQPRLGLLTYNELPYVVTKEIPYFEKLAVDGKIQLVKLRSLESTKKHTEFAALRDFWKNEFNLAHLACHACYEDDSPSQSSIRLADDFPVTLMDFEVYGIKINGYPLVILNACETGNLNPLYTSCFAAAFLKHGARGVVATEGIVPDAFAAEFVEKLYSHLLAGERLGDSLLLTRRYFLDVDNPSGLLYSMYASPEIRLVQEGNA